MFQGEAGRTPALYRLLFSSVGSTCKRRLGRCCLSKSRFLPIARNRVFGTHTPRQSARIGQHEGRLGPPDARGQTNARLVVGMPEQGKLAVIAVVAEGF
jgi:hypothetical protein